MDQSAVTSLLGCFPDFDSFWQDVLDEVSSLHEDFNLINQLKGNYWSPSEKANSQSQLVDHENGMEYPDVSEDNLTNLNEQTIGNNNSRLRKNQMKTPKTPRPLTLTAAARAQEARKRKQSNERK
ncbi:uncharacterized protein LOC134853890 [Symsagittifera roscoffensis]|uniref:uncharacterized protein LOC134853890 n=1 Tax=Symsagittifera roscoffensis TaxID=84072 RepID=UPI00307C5208